MIDYLEKPYKPEQIRHILNPIVDKWFFTKFREFSLPQLFGVMEIHSYLNYFSYHFESDSMYQLLNHDFWFLTNIPLDTGHARVIYLKEKNQLGSFNKNNLRFKMVLNKNNQKNKNKIVQLPQRLERELVLEIYKFALNIRKERYIGQRTIIREIKKKFGINVSENTVSGWIYKGIVPYANEKTQFKPKPTPPKKNLYDLYINQNLSASKIAKKSKVSTIIVINWLKKYDICVRTHKESMTTVNIKKELANLKFNKPTKNFKLLTPEKAYVLGVLCGDGYIDNKTIRFEIRYDEEFIKEFSECVKKVYGLKYSHKYYAKRNTFVLYVSSKLISKDLLNYGNFRTFSWGVPKEILNCNDKKIISSYLRAIFDCEGSVGRYDINFTSSSYSGIVGVSLLLKKVGIDCRIKKIRDGKYSTLFISKKINLRLFKDLIGFTIKRKMQKLENTYRLGW